MHLFRRGRRNRLRGLHLLQNEIAIDQTLQSSLRRVARAVDAERLQDRITPLLIHVALQDDAAVDNGHHMIEHDGPRGHRSSGGLLPTAPAPIMLPSMRHAVMCFALLIKSSARY